MNQLNQPHPDIMNALYKQRLDANPNGSIASPEPRAIPQMEAIDANDDSAEASGASLARQLGKKVLASFLTSKQTGETTESTST